MQVAQTLRKASSDTNARARSQSNIIKHHRKYGAFGQNEIRQTNNYEGR